MEGLKLLLEQVETEVSTQIDKQVKEVVTDLKKQVEDLRQFQPTIVVKDSKKHKVEGLKHKQLNDLIRLVGADQNTLMVGMAGTGKTKGAEQAAEALKLPFYTISVGSQTSKADLLGYMDAHGKYVSTTFRKAYEEGGVYLMDEIDAGNSNVLIVLNSALSNGLCSFPDGMIKRHKDFRFIATANTYGNGADRTYVGRNQLDGATLDRFVVVDWKVDEKLEELLVGNFIAGKAWVETVKELRKHVQSSGIRAIVSPRMSVKGAMCLELDMTSAQTIEMVVLPQIPTDKRESVREFTQKKLNEKLMAFPPKMDGDEKSKTEAKPKPSFDLAEELPF